MRGRSKARGRAYIDATDALRRPGDGGKSGESPRYTVRGDGMAGGGRRAVQWEPFPAPRLPSVLLLEVLNYRNRLLLTLLDYY